MEVLADHPALNTHISFLPSMVYGSLIGQLPNDRVGGQFHNCRPLTPSTYGSVYGGSGYANKSVYRIPYRDQFESIPELLR